MKVAILVPLYERVYHLPRLSQNLAAVTPEATIYLRVVPGVTPAFKTEPNMKVVESETTRYPHGINELGRLAREDGFEWLFIGADDLNFHEGWYEEAQRVAYATGALVIGTNDLCNPRVIAGEHATHMLVRSLYLDWGTFDKKNELMSEAYLHNFVDDEIKLTAQSRNVHAHADRSHVEHLHPISGKTEWDSTYERGSGGENFERDQAVFTKRVRQIPGIQGVT